MTLKKIVDYNTLTQIDRLISNTLPEYPFQLNEKAIYTQHQIVLYRNNYCHKETDEPPSITGGSIANVFIADF